MGRECLLGERNKEEARIKVLLLALLTTFLVSLLGFRTQTLVSLLAFALLMYRYSLIGNVEVLGTLGLALAAVSGLGFYRAAQTGYSVGFLEVVGKRIGLTVSIFDYIATELYNSGLEVMLTGVYQGKIALATFSSFLGFIPGPHLGPRTIVAREFGVEGVTLTSTLLGPVALDWGLVGVCVFTLLLGMVIGMAFHNSRASASPFSTAFFCILFAYLLTGIETGLVDFNVFLLFALSALISLASVKGGGQ